MMTASDEYLEEKVPEAAVPDDSTSLFGKQQGCLEACEAGKYRICTIEAVFMSKGRKDCSNRADAGTRGTTTTAPEHQLI